MKKIIHTQNAPQTIGPYAQAVSIDGFLFISGQIALNPITGDLELESIEVETHRVMNNLKSILEEASLDFSNVVKVQFF